MPYQRLKLNLGGAKLRKAELEGRTHIVVKASILPPDVIEGSAGPIYYPDEENGKSTNAWNYKPIVVYHPMDDDTPISACDPTILNTRKVGVMLRTVNKSNLQTECWLDEERTNAVDARIIKALKAGKKIEVSTGLEFDESGGPGRFNGKKYRTTARNYRPDHLAILPDGEGAFSVSAGGGMYAFNQALRQPEGYRKMWKKAIVEALKPLGFELVKNELSFSMVSQQLSELLASTYGEPGKYWPGYLCEVFADYCVYCTDGKCWRQDYTTKEDVVTLKGEPTEVQRVVSYETVTAAVTDNSAVKKTKKKERQMAFDKAAHVKGLVGNGFAETDRLWLEKLSDEQLQKIKPVVNAATTTGTEVTTETVTVPTPGVTVPVQQNVLTADQYVANAPPEIRSVLADGLASQRIEKENLVKKILGYALNQFTEDQLRKTPVPNLRAVAAMIPAQHGQNDEQSALVGNEANPIHYFGANGGAVNRYTQPLPEETLALPEI